MGRLGGPLVSRALFRHDGSPAAQAHLEALTRLTRADMGAERAVFRALPGWGLLLWILVPTLLIAVAALAIAPSPIGAVVILAVGTLVALAFVVGGWFDRIRVCDQGLVLGLRATVVVPWESVDPGRVYLTRGAFVARHVAAAVGATRGSSGRMVVLNGTQRGLFMLNAAGAHDGGPSPFGWYLLGGHHPSRLLAAIEAAMVAAGFTEAHGLAPSTEQLRRIRTTYRVDGPLVTERGALDPPLGVDHPA
ncbi:hypothetical protein JAAN108728_03440 [Janibacter anophelis]